MHLSNFFDFDISTDTQIHMHFDSNWPAASLTFQLY